ncbi:MFS transporter [Rhodococcus sp. HNM0563]|uniref:MFS transporter n=1 Tax=unclassified Rhodococcus (in: high G+C Gram-positive bacteria) TaxID=192944 RepID=UPI00146A32A1|nr:MULTISPECIES: MFS transporter [unclassified Rhodococcus (in: high G+C Gram-positive bacteria)]MCK0089844.1 MFS transporter [Rhodococcus sp. F64268]NLU62207.1 MFS transporter [Rhodococcus sp. HNM0563]
MAVDSPIPTRERPVPRAIVPVLALCGIGVALMQTLIVPLLPQLPVLVDATPENTSWAVTATLLAGAVITPISGRLGDMFGKRRMLIVSLGMMVLGSGVCALSTTLIPLVVGRTLQGAAVGAIPLGIAILRDELPPRKIPAAMATLSATLGVGGAIGLPFAAFVAQLTTWHMLFVVSGIIGVIGIAAVLYFVPESSQRNPGRFDYLGAVLLSIALVLLLLPVSKGNTWGWSSPITLGMFAGAIAVFVGWGMYELRLPRPLVDLRISGRRPVLMTNLASIALGFAMYSNVLAFPQLLMAPSETGYGFGQSMVMAGLVLAPSGLVMMALSPVSAGITRRFGARATLACGAATVGLGYLVAYLLYTEVWHILVAAMIIGAGVGLAYAAMPALIMAAVPLTESAAANSLNTLMRSIGTSTAAAVIGVVLAAMTTRIGDAVVPSLDGFRITFLIAVVAAIVSLAITALIPRPAPTARRFDN